MAAPESIQGGDGSAASGGPSFDQPVLTETLWSEPYRFEFFAALRVLARLAEDAPGSADDPRPVLERVRFRSFQSLSFPASEITDISRDKSGKWLADMTVAFLGLTGPMGVLPRPYSALVIQRTRKGDHALRNFLDLFNHRLLQIFARAGEKYRFYLTHEIASARQRVRQLQGPQKLRGFLLEERPRLDLFSQILLDLGSVGTPLLRYKDSVRDRPASRIDLPDATLRYFSGLLSQTHRSAVGLAQMVAEYFNVEARVVPFVGQWVQLPVEHQTCMRRRELVPLPGGQIRGSSCAEPRLGRNTVVGARVWELQGRFRVRLGPLKFEQFRDFLPEGRQHRVLVHMARLYAGPAFDFDIQPVLEGREVPWCQLGSRGPQAPRLGWNTWLRNREFTAPVDDAIFPVRDEISQGA